MEEVGIAISDADDGGSGLATGSLRKENKVVLFGFSCAELMVLGIAGGASIADAAEDCVRRWILPVLQTQWGVTDAEKANQGNLNTCGGVISTLAVEIIADNWGHRPTFILCLALVLAFGVGSAWATTFDAFSALRFGAQLGGGVIPLPFVLIEELMTNLSNRARANMLVSPFWSAGMEYGDLLAGKYMTDNGNPTQWRRFVVLMGVPMALLLVWAWFRLPEPMRSASEKQDATPSEQESGDNQARQGSGSDIPLLAAHAKPQNRRCAAAEAGIGARLHVLLLGEYRHVMLATFCLWSFITGGASWNGWFVLLGERKGLSAHYMA